MKRLERPSELTRNRGGSDSARFVEKKHIVDTVHLARSFAQAALSDLPHRDSDGARASSDLARTSCLCTGCNGSGRVALLLVVSMKAGGLSSGVCAGFVSFGVGDS